MASLESTQKPHKRLTEDGDVDCISKLPESIIYDIISLAPTKNAVATSLLSKDWRFHWTNVTSFDYDDHSVEFDKMEFVDSDEPESDDSDESDNDDLPNIQPFCPVLETHPHRDPDLRVRFEDLSSNNHRRKDISKELYEFCLDQGYADRYLIAKWKKVGLFMLKM